MRQTLSENLNRNIDTLKSLLSQYDTYTVLGYFSSFLTLHIQNIFDKTGLSSPCKQILYLGGLLLSTEQKDTKNFGEEDFTKVRELLEQIAKFYELMFFPSPKESGNSLSEKRMRAIQVSMPVFLNYFNTALLCQPEQLFERMNSWFMPFDGDFKKDQGVSIKEIIAIYQFLLNALQEQLNTIQRTQQKFEEERINFHNTYDEQKYTLEQMRYFAERHPVKDAAIIWYENLISVYKFPIAEVKKHFEHEAVDNFLRLFSLERSERNFRFYTEHNPFEASPIWRISEEQIFLGFLQMSHYSLYSSIITLIEKSDFKHRYYKHRDKESEKKVCAIFQSLFGDTAEYYPSIYENNNSENEHDLLVCHKRDLLIIEVKASKIKAPFRDPEKAFVRIQRDFRSDRGIQKAYDQGLHLKQLILSQPVIPLFNKQGETVGEIQREDFDNIYILCITAEQLGPIACNLSLLLSKPDSEPYPWSCNLFDLENFVEALHYVKFSPEAFVDYLDERTRFHEKLYATDELEIAGFYLHYGFEAIEQHLSSDVITFARDMSNIFDKIYFEKKGIGYDLKVGNKPRVVDVQQEFLKSIRIEAET